MSTVEYDDIYHITNSTYDDAYKRLMQKESIVLDTVNRVINHKEEEKRKKGLLYVPVNILIYRIFETIKNVFIDLSKRKPLQNVLNEKRIPYIGCFIIICCLCFLILDIFK